MKETFFTHDKNFYRNLFSMLVIVALQNVIARRPLRSATA